MKRVVIVGGGIGGLTAALAFHEIGWEVRVLERAPEIAEVGAGIQISANGYKPLAALGLGPALEAAGSEPARLTMRRGLSGREVFSIDWAPALRRRYGAPYLAIHRADLIDILAGALAERAPGALRVGAEVSDLTNGADGAAALLADGDAEEGDLVIGADGLHSVMRGRLLGPERPVFTGNVAWRCVAPAAEAPGMAGGVTVWTGAGRHAVTYPIRRGELINFVGIVEQDAWVAEGWSEPSSRDETLAEFAGWAPALTRVIEAAQRHLKWGLFSRPPLPRWQAGRAALLGDACHPMPPSLAQGACQAIEDAAALARLVAAEGVAAALPAYEAARKPRATRVQRQSFDNLRRFHASGPVARLATFGPMRAAGLIWPEAIRMQNAWVYAGGE